VNKGWTWPYDLSLRTWMGGRTHRQWIRKEYTVSAPGGAFWHGPSAGLMTTNPPYAISRQRFLETFDAEFVMAGFVETIAGGDVYIGFRAFTVLDGTQVYYVDQVWLAGVPQMSEAGALYVPGLLTFWSTGGVPHVVEPGEQLASSPVTYQPVPYPP